MELNEIIQALSVINEDVPLPREALAEAARNKETVTPVLMDALDKVYEGICASDEDITEDPAYSLSFYAIFLLAQFREQRAFPKLLQILKLDADRLDLMLGDAVSNMGDILYSVYNGDFGAVKEVVVDSSLSPFAREAALSVLDGLLRDGRLPREELVVFLRERLAALEDGEDEEDFGAMLAKFIADNDLYELAEDVREAYRQEKIDVMYIGDFDGFFDELYNEDQYPEHTKTIEDAARELNGWACFKDETPPRPSMEEILSWKAGRNDPCPCGSGKKFKKCCLARQEALKQSIYAIPEIERDHYPPVDRKGDRPGLSDFYSNDAIAIDRLAYQAMIRLYHPNRQERADKSRVRKEIRGLLWQAFEKFREICAKEGFEAPEEFDQDYKMHYLSREWLDALCELLKFTEDKRYQEVERVLFQEDI